MRIRSVWLKIPAWVRFWVLIPIGIIIASPIALIISPIVFAVAIVWLIADIVWDEWKIYKKEPK